MYRSVCVSTLAFVALMTTNVCPVAAQRADWISQLGSIVEREMADKSFPSFALVLVDSGRVVAKITRGSTGGDGGMPVSPSTRYRTGSVGKTLTDLAVLITVQRGRVDLDTDVKRYLPSFSPGNPSGEPVTLRQLMVHTSGLVREPPVGSYFDASSPGLAETVASLNGTELLWAPGTRTKYSNAGLAVVGRVLEAVWGADYGDVMQALVFGPAGMATAVVGRQAARSDVALGVMRRPDGTDWAAPTFDLGMSPAGDLYASIRDLASLMRVLLADDGRLLDPAMLHLMWTPEPPREDWQLDVGLGFSLNGRFAGAHRMARHGGAVYGFATELALLPEDRLGVRRRCAGSGERDGPGDCSLGIAGGTGGPRGT